MSRHLFKIPLVRISNQIIVHKHALEDAGILHRDVSPANLFLACAKGRTDHGIHMNELLDEIRERLCQRIRNLPQWGVLGDWGYANAEARSPTSTPSKPSPLPRFKAPHPDGPPTSLVDAESPTEYDNRVLVRKVGSDDTPTLLSVSKLTNEHDIVLLTGADDPNKDPRQTINLCPLYRTVSLLFHQVH